MFRFLRYFALRWYDYDSYRWFCDEHLGEEKFEEIMKREKDPVRARRMHNSRFWYALEGVRVMWRHRDRYGRKCRKYSGDCMVCNAKHC